MELEILDVGAACRLCLAVGSDHVPIFHEAETDFANPVSLPQRIGACVGFEVKVNDEFPSLVCTNCLQEVDRWFVFRTQCRNTNELLSKVLAEGCQFVAAPAQEKAYEPNTLVEIIVESDEPQLQVNNVEGPCELVEEATQSQPNLILQYSKDAGSNVKSNNQTVVTNDNDTKGSNFSDDFDDMGNEAYQDTACQSDSEDFSDDDGITEETNDDTKWRLKPVSCPLCAKQFSKHSGVKLHLRVVHAVRKFYPCFICAHISCLSKGRIKHIAKRHPKETLQKRTCTLCGIVLKTSSTFHRHLRKHEAERRCGLCNILLDSIEALYTHKKTAHQEEAPDGIEHNFFCHHCENVSFWKEADWKAHYLDVHNTEEVFPCDMCDKAFRTKSLLAIHARVHTGERPYMCELCATRFTSRHSLRNHRRKHTTKFQCDQCDKTYTSKAGLYYHKNSHTGDTPFVCDQCGKRFKSGQGLDFHMRIHSGEKPYSCEHCDYTSRTSSGLYSHRVIHSDERPFKCDQCDKSFKLKSWLKEHQKTHAGIKSFVCEICDHGFIAAYQLRSHMKTHSGERPHICQFCSKSFARRDTLTEHLRTHTKETKYSCQSCNRDFMFLKQFKKHKCTHSSLETVQELSVSGCSDGSD